MKRKILIGVVLLFIITGGLIVSFDYTSSVRFDKETQSRIDASSRVHDGKFTGPEVSMSLSKLGDMFYQRFWGENKESRVAGEKLPVKDVELKYFNNTESEELNATWLGHSSLMINIDGYRIITDPVFTQKITFIGPERYNGELPLDMSELTEVDLVIISHDHYDHLNKESVLLLSRLTKKFVVPLGVSDRLQNWGIPNSQIVELDWWEEYRYDSKLLVAATPAQHFSGRALTDRNKTLWASWVVKSANHSFFFSGDSGYFDGFKDIGRQYGPFNMTFLECGAYNTMWSKVHMFPEQTVQAHLDLKGDVLHPVHWGTFNLAFHAWNEPMERLSRAAFDAGVRVSTPVAGDTTLYGRKYHTTAWWAEDKGGSNKIVYASF